MQTFLPVKSFVKSMEYLDRERLGKQRVEAGQILEILLPSTSVFRHEDDTRTVVSFDRNFHAWVHHPAVLMWKGHEEWLKLYLACAIGEWCSRGYRNTILVPIYDTDTQPPPSWLGFEPFHQSHRSNLLRKLPSHYRQYWPEEQDDLSYFWPSKEVIPA